jgi:hypothetical protein
VRNELSRYPPRPVVSESLITFVKIPLIPCAQAPAKFFEFFLINFAKIGIINNLSNPALARSNRLRYLLLGPAKAA